MDDPKPRIVLIEYTNWRGERGRRRILPNLIRFGRSEWHGEDQWLLRAYDLDKGALREFAMKDIHDWSPEGQ